MADIADIYTAAADRYEKMTYNRVGRSGLKFPAVSLGLWHNFGSKDNYDNMKAMCRTAFDNGITQFDVANNYGPVYGSAEKSLGRILKDDFMPYRDELVIATKAGYDMWDGPYGDGGSRKYLMASLDQSLKRLGLDYVDVLTDIVRSGKALYAGVSNYNEEYTKRAVELLRERHCPFIVNQRRYSIYDRTIEEDGVKDCCRENGVGIIAFSPLAQGRLTDKYLHGIPEDSRVARDPRFLHKSDITAELVKKTTALNEIAKLRGQSLAQMALAWILKDGDVCSVLIGASRPEQILDNIAALKNTTFTKEELDAIDQISRA